MAKNAPVADETPEIEIHTHVAGPKALPYSQHVKRLADAYTEGNTEAATTIRVPNGEKNADGVDMSVAKHKRYVQDAAKAAGYSAKVWDVIDYGDGTSTIEFGLRPIIKRTRKPVEAAESTTDEAAQAA